MLSSLLLLLLPLAAASGWWAAKRSEKRREEEETPPSPEYLKGLNYLLNEQTDKAIGVFVKMLEVNSETVEIHLALGNLFRRRGEVDRAIRVHQNLIARPSLNKIQRELVFLELGQDYMKAGVLDRAEQIFQDLIESEHKAKSLRYLRNIYEKEKEWENAIQMAEQYQSVSNEEQHVIIAQYYCELAQIALDRDDYELVTKHVKKAFSFDKTCARGSLIKGASEAKQAEFKAAMRSYRRVEQQDPIYLSEIIRPMYNCHEQLGTLEAYLNELKRILDEYRGLTVMVTLVDLMRKLSGEKETADYLSGYVHKHPSLLGMVELVDLIPPDSQSSSYVRYIKEALERLLEERNRYRCQNCGFSSKTIYWQCPSCRRWCSIKPVEDLGL